MQLAGMLGAVLMMMCATAAAAVAAFDSAEQRQLQAELFVADTEPVVAAGANPAAADPSVKKLDVKRLDCNFRR